MGRDIHVRILQKNRNNNTWERVSLLHKEKDEIKIIDVYPFRNYELFDILSENEEDGYNADNIIIDDLPLDIKQEIEEYKNNSYGYNFKEITLADLKLYLHQMPKIRDWDYEEDNPNAWKDNPVKDFIDRITQYLNFVDPYWNFNLLSNIRIVYWFDS